MKLYKIHWNDIVAAKDWLSSKEALSWGEKKFKTLYFTTGYIVHRNKRFVIIASSYTIEEDGELSYNDVSMIPLSVVRKIEKI